MLLHHDPDHECMLLLMRASVNNARSIYIHVRTSLPSYDFRGARSGRWNCTRFGGNFLCQYTTDVVLNWWDPCHGYVTNQPSHAQPGAARYVVHS
jgi:hypothetical protein